MHAKHALRMHIMMIHECNIHGVHACIVKLHSCGKFLEGMPKNALHANTSASMHCFEGNIVIVIK